MDNEAPLFYRRFNTIEVYLLPSCRTPLTLTQVNVVVVGEKTKQKLTNIPITSDQSWEKLSDTPPPAP